MKIARFIYEWPPPWIGLVPAPFELTQAQAKLGHKITVFSGRWPKAGALEKIEGVINHTFWREPIKGFLSLTITPIMTLYFLIWRLSNKSDIYHIHGHFGLGIYLFRTLLPFIDKTPIVAHFHNTVAGRWEKAKSENKKIGFVTKYIDWPLALISDKLAIKHAKAYVFVSENLKEEAVNYYKADPSKCYVLESAVNTNLFKPLNAEHTNLVKKEMGFNLDDIVIGNIGFIVERKNIHLLIESLLYLPDNYKVFIGGKYDASYRNRLNSLIEKHALQKRVVFKEERDYKDIHNYYQVCDIFALPSSYEGFPKAVLEALACGIPTIASGFKLPNIKGLYELTSFDSQILSQSILEISKNSISVDCDFVAENFSWDRRAKDLDLIYNKIV